MKNRINNRRYMQMAIEEMKKSRSEHKTKTDPIVGAVLVGKDGKVLDKTHRGSLREGDHAEYTLIERKLGDRNLEGSTLYVTLEPCTTRGPSKIPCAERIVTARIEKVFYGIPDPNPDIGGKVYWYLTRNGVKVDSFDLDLVHQIIKENEEFINQFEDMKKNQSRRLSENSHFPRILFKE